MFNLSDEGDEQFYSSTSQLCIRYLELLNKHKPKMKWDDHCAEHYFSYK